MTTDVNADKHPSTLAAIRDLVVLERHDIDDTNTAALFDGDAEYALALVVNEDSDATAVVSTDGPGNNASIVDGAAYGNSQGSGSNNNVYHDGSNYVIENQNGSAQSYTVVGVAEV
jgi:hypothetical protein